jgi:Zn-dependent M28 family amino/carboxypeptidase
MFRGSSNSSIAIALVCSVLCAADIGPAPKKASEAITSEGILRHIRILASDEFEGRGPGSEGEKRTLNYIVGQCKALKLAAGNPDGSYLQKVPLWGIASTGEVKVQAAGASFPLEGGVDYRVSSTRPTASIDIAAAPIVFVGYGIVAPEYQWDDYKNIDVKGKAVLILGGDPPIADPNDPAKLDPKMFLGPELSYYGRPSTKAELAWKRGAVAVMTLFTPRGMYPTFASMARFLPRESMIIRDQFSNDRIAATVTLTTDKGKQLLATTGQDLETLRKAAVSRSFTPVPLNASIEIHSQNQVREIDSANLVAKIVGRDPKLRNEYVVYSGHWDHLGRQDDNIFHGASDNASGTAGVLELARAFTKLPAPPKRSVLFLWTTAEEKGLLGAKYYVEHPLYPLSQTVANINLDYFSNWGWGRTKDFSILGSGMSSLDDLVKEAVSRQGRVITGDTAPEEGFYWRSDHLEFAMGGVPSLASSPGIDFVGRPEGYGAQKRQEYIRNDYHKPSDQVKPDWDLTGAVEDLQVLFEVGYRVAQEDSKPTWRNRGPYLYNPRAGN